MATKRETLEYRKVNNLCPRDGRPNKSGRVMCEYCLKKSAEKTERHRQKKKANSLCLCCGVKVDNAKFCDKCKETVAITSRESHNKCYQKRKNMGICIICSDPVSDDKTLCSKCLIAKNIYQKKRHDSFATDDMCYDCGKNPPVDKGKRCQTCIDKRNKWYQGSPTQAKDKVRRDEHREVVLKHYGSKCIQCGESRPACLAVDHIDGDGNTHRRKIGKYGSGFFKWLVDNDFPEGFQLLCHNCNMEKYLNSGV